MTQRTYSILHIEDDSLWQTVIAAALRGWPRTGQLQSASTASDGLAVATALRPDIVLLDLGLPDADGSELARDLLLSARPPRVVIVSVRRDSAVLHTASEPHIAGLLWKAGDLIQQLPIALEAVAAGAKYYPPDVRAALRRFRADPQAFFKLLSPREVALLPHFARAEKDGEIAAALGVSEHTARAHRRNVMQKLDLHTSARLTHWAIVHGFGFLPRSSASRADAGPV
ncbi:MAG: response regulator transcription factor [Candidatus Didemnitutus sp.]|nr:response regulator transcription factor [Candidatus Didemnitutus sp.]